MSFKRKLKWLVPSVLLSSSVIGATAAIVVNSPNDIQTNDLIDNANTSKINEVNESINPLTNETQPSLFEDISNSAYTVFNNQFISGTRWKRLIGKNNLLNIVTDNSNRNLIKILKTKIDSDGLVSSSIEQVDFSNEKINNQLITEVYYSGGCYSEALQKFVIVLSFKVNNAWYPQYLFIDDSSNFTVHHDVTKNSLKGQYFDANSQKWIETVSCYNKKPEFKVVQFQHRDDLVVDPTFYIYLTDQNGYDVNQLWCANGPSISQMCFSVNKTSSAITYKNEYIWNRSLTECLQKPGAGASSWYNTHKILNITPFLLKTSNTTFEPGLVYYVSANDKSANILYTILTNKKISDTKEIGKLIEENQLSNGALYLNYDPNVDYFTTDPCGELIFIDNNKLNGWDDGFVFSGLINNSNRNYGFNNFVFAFKQNNNQLITKVSGLFLNNLQSSNDIDITNWYLDKKNKKMIFYSSYFKLSSWGSAYNGNNCILSLLDFNKQSTNKYIFDYTLPTYSSQPTFNQIETDFSKVYGPNLSNFYLTNVPNGKQLYKRDENNVYFYPIVIPSNTFSLYIPGLNSIFNLKTFIINQQTNEIDVSQHANEFPGFATKNSHDILNNELEQAIKDLLLAAQSSSSLFTMPFCAISDPSLYSSSGSAAQLADKWKHDFINQLQFTIIDNMNGKISFKIKSGYYVDNQFNLVSNPNSAGPVNGLGNQLNQTTFTLTHFKNWNNETSYAQPNNQANNEYNLPQLSNITVKSLNKNSLEKILNDNKQKFVNNLPKGGEIILKELTPGKYWDDSLYYEGKIKVKINVTKTSTATGGAQNVPLPADNEITITGFKKLTTTLKISQLTWSDQQFIDIFNSQSKAYRFAIDFYKDRNDLLIKFQNYNNLNSFFNDGDGNVTISSGTFLPDITRNTITFSFSFSGFNNGEPSNNLPGKITLSFKELPFNDPATNPLLGFEQYLQTEVDANGFPKTATDFNQTVCNYLNQPNIKNELPLYPQTFNPSDIDFNFANLRLDTNPIVISETQNPISINYSKYYGTDLPTQKFPTITINTSSKQILNSIQASSTIASYIPTSLVSSSPNQNDPQVKEIKSFLNKNIKKIFQFLPTNATITTIDNIQVSTINQKDIDVTFTIDKFIDSTSGSNPISKQCKITITGLNGVAAGQTSINIKSTIVYNDPDFDTIFGTSPSYKFFIDFKNQVDFTTPDSSSKSIMSTKLKSYIETNNLFINPYQNSTNTESSIVSKIEFKLVPNTTNIVAKIYFDGYDASGKYSQLLSQDVTFELKASPTFDEIFLPDLQQSVIYEVTQGAGLNSAVNSFKSYVLNILKQKYNNGIMPNSWDVNNLTANEISFTSKINRGNNTNSSIVFNNVNIAVKKDAPLTGNVTCEIDTTHLANDTVSIQNDPVLGKISIDSISDINQEANNKQLITNYINDNKETLFVNFPSPSWTGTCQSILKIGVDKQHPRAIKVTFKMSNVISLDNYKGTGTSQFTICLTDFLASKFPNTLLKDEYKTLNATVPNDIFYTIFTNDKGFTVDWISELNRDRLETIKNKLKTYLSKHYKDCFNRPSSSHLTTNDGVKSVDIVQDPNNENTWNATVTFFGYKNDLDNQICKETITINLRPTLDATNALQSLQTDIQTWADKYGMFPGKTELASIVADYLNKPNIQAEIPNSWIPSSKTFKETDITVNDQLINTNTDPIIINQNVIKTTTNIIFPQYSIKKPIPKKVTSLKQKTIQVGIKSDIAKLKPEDIFNEFKSNASGANVLKVANYIETEANTYFNNWINGAKVTIIGIGSFNTNDLIDVKISVDKAYQQDETIASSEFTVDLVGFCRSDVKTTLKITKISYKDQLFKDIFNNNSGFAVDWSVIPNELVTQQTAFETYVNNNFTAFFDNPIIGINQTQVSQTKITADPQYSGKASIKFFANVYGDAGLEINQEYTIDLELKSIDRTSDDFYHKVWDNICNWANNNQTNNPADEQVIKTIVNETIQTNPELIPQVYYDPSQPVDITIDMSRIKIDKSTVVLDTGAISINPSSTYNTLCKKSLINFKISNIEYQNNPVSWWVWLLVGLGSFIGVLLIVIAAVYIIRHINHVKAFKQQDE